MVIIRGIQTTDTDEHSQREAESELIRVKEQLRSAENHIAHLLERVSTYRYRWLTEYHRAENLELHMPNGVYVPDLDQIREDIASPGFMPELLAWDSEGNRRPRRYACRLTKKLAAKNEPWLNIVVLAIITRRTIKFDALFEVEFQRPLRTGPRLCEGFTP
ncbi:hypothetical protein C8R48DRAFT_673437 [Suillus tomentosus]|nr:hypothetical protein C8R48DRAFT_673437 [Suillus tomentosus]